MWLNFSLYLSESRKRRRKKNSAPLKIIECIRCALDNVIHAHILCSFFSFVYKFHITQHSQIITYLTEWRKHSICSSHRWKFDRRIGKPKKRRNVCDVYRRGGQLRIHAPTNRGEWLVKIQRCSVTSRKIEGETKQNAIYMKTHYYLFILSLCSVPCMMSSDIWSANDNVAGDVNEVKRNKMYVYIGNTNKMLGKSESVSLSVPHPYLPIIDKHYYVLLAMLLGYDWQHTRSASTHITFTARKHKEELQQQYKKRMQCIRV